MISDRDNVIHLESVKKVFLTDEVETHALAGIDLEIKRGEYFSISGPSGCGKSTLLSILGLLDSPSDGSFQLNGKPVQDLSMSERARVRNREIGFIFQAFNLIGDLTIYENVELPLTLTHLPRRERKEHVEAALDVVGLSDRADHYPRQLSGGQEQRVAIARALANDPELLIADEPTGNLDPDTADRVFAMLQELVESQKLALLMATHNYDLAEQMSRIVEIRAGVLSEL